MKEELITDALLREFLLGKVSEEDRQRIEDLFLTDSQTKESLLVIEQDLIEDYLEDNLAPEDKDRFLTLYAKTAEQRRGLRITKSIKDWAVSEAKVPQVSASRVSFWSRLQAGLRLKPVFVVPAAAVVVIAIALAIVWVTRMMDQRRHFEAEQELVQLNSLENLSQFSPQLLLELRPGATRAAQSPVVLTKRTEVKIVELRLPWIRAERYPTYRAEVGRIGDTVPLIISNLQPEKDARVIRLRLSAARLDRGNYQIKLVGLNSDGSPGIAEEYIFTVVE